MSINKIVDPNIAANAYANTSGVAKKGVTGNDEGISFSDFLKNKVSQSAEAVREGERMSGRAVTGDADLTDVVEAVTAAELTLQTVVAVRDRMISAYQEILRMPM
jgi:flagellar hook-basal body complex protein FliE